MTVRRALKVAVARLLYATGMLQAWQRRTLRAGAVVLMYHRVLTAEERATTASHPAIVVSLETFERQMALLARRFNVMSLERFAHHLEERIPFPDSTVVVTFDDGWRDNASNALPVLERHGVPALVFLPAAYVNTDRVFWQEALVSLLTQAVREHGRNASRSTAVSELLASVGLDTLLGERGPGLPQRVQAAVGQQKAMPRSQMSALIERLASALGVRLGDLSRRDGFMDWDGVAAMKRGGVDFGGHGVDHLLLTQVSEQDLENEVRGSKQFVDGSLRTPVATFSYPNGYLNDRVVDSVRSAGFRLAFTTKRGIVRCTDDRLTIGRLNVHENMTDSDAMFMARLVGLF